MVSKPRLVRTVGPYKFYVENSRGHVHSSNALGSVGYYMGADSVGMAPEILLCVSSTPTRLTGYFGMVEQTDDHFDKDVFLEIVGFICADYPKVFQEYVVTEISQLLYYLPYDNKDILTYGIYALSKGLAGKELDIPAIRRIMEVFDFDVFADDYTEKMHALLKSVGVGQMNSNELPVGDSFDLGDYI